MKIEFRGKLWVNAEDIEPGEIAHVDGWVFGGYFDDFIWNKEEKNVIKQWCAVDPKTVGQYTNLNDKNGKKIFDGDRCWDEYSKKYGEVLFKEGRFICIYDDITEDLFIVAGDIKVIGNVWDNPELLEVQNEI